MDNQLASNTAVLDNENYYADSGIMLITDEGKPGAKPTTPILRNFGSLPIMYWGNGNDYPQKVIAMVNNSPELLSLIDFLVTVLYGGGLFYEVYKENEKGEHTWVRGYDAEVESWMQYNNIQDFLLELIIDFVWFNHGFAELIKNKKGDKIVQVTHQEAAFCRFGIQNQKTGYNDKVFINANWPVGSYDDEWTTEVHAINPRDVLKVSNLYNSKEYKVIYPINYPAPGKLIYQLPGWHALLSSGWFDIGTEIPILKKALMQLQMTIKYVIKIPQAFWDMKAKEKKTTWLELSADERKVIKSEVRKEMNDFLTGSKNAGKSFITTFSWDPISKSEIPGISITSLDDKLQDGKYIEDSKEASGQYIRSLGIPAPLIGPISSGDMGGGSGSDARIHFNILNKRLKPRKDKIVSPLNFIAEYNGWTKRLPGFRFAIEDFVIDTLDVSHSTTNPSPKATDGQSN